MQNYGSMLMSIFVYASNKERKEKIKELCAHVFESEKKIEEYTFHKIGNNILIIDNNEVCNFVGITLNNLKNVYLYEQNQIFSLIKDEAKLLAQRKQYITEKHWDAAKKINDVILNSDFLLRRSKPSGFPDYLQIETTSNCNAECIMCSHYYTKNRNTSYLSKSIIEKLSDTLPYTRVVSINGGGEPFINPHISSQIEEFVKFGAKISSTTNLSFINDTLISHINSHFISLQLSCDGATKETYELIRKNLSFEFFLKNLSLLQEKCPEIDKYFVTVIMRQNIRELPDIVDIAGRAGIKKAIFMNINTNPIIANEHDSMRNYPTILYYYLNKVKKIGEHFGIKIIAPPYNELLEMTEFSRELELLNSKPMIKSNDEFVQMLMATEKLEPYIYKNIFPREKPKKSTVKCTGICDWLLRRAYISSYGDVSICCINMAFHCGNVNKLGSFQNVWSSDYYQNIRDIFYSGYLPDCCLGCGLIEQENFMYLKIEITDDFYQESEYKKTRNRKTQELLTNPLNGNGG